MFQRSRVFIGILGLLCGTGVGFVLANSYVLDAENNATHAVRQGGFDFINPLLECEVANSIENKSLQSMKGEVEHVIRQVKDEKRAEHVSVYYRDLNNGAWYGIDEQEAFAPASLLKVPIMMAYYSAAEKDPSILTKEILSEDGTETKPASEYISRMIILSDNPSFHVLTNSIDFNTINTVHEALGIPIPAENTPQDFITVKQYASLFRVLYNASYLSREYSEQALALMTNAKFVEGLVAGVPKTISVSHKFGVQGKSGDTTQQLHDCGVVYYPEHPYLLCVMTKGSSAERQTSVIRDISSTIYQWMERQYAS